MTYKPKYPQIKVRLSSLDGNSFSIMGAVTKAMKRAGLSEDDCNSFRREATSGDYGDMLQTCKKWVSVS